jgi:hypothetical protein
MHYAPANLLTCTLTRSAQRRAHLAEATFGKLFGTPLEQRTMPRAVHCIKDGELGFSTQQGYQTRRVALTSQDMVFSYPEGEIVLDVIPNHKIVEVAPVSMLDLQGDPEPSVALSITSESHTPPAREGRRWAIAGNLFYGDGATHAAHAFKIVTQLAEDNFQESDSNAVGRTYILVAESEDECEEWIQVSWGWTMTDRVQE